MARDRRPQVGAVGPGFKDRLDDPCWGGRANSGLSGDARLQGFPQTISAAVRVPHSAAR